MKFLFVALSLLTTVALFAQKPVPCPCCEGKFRQFDFWAGSWEAYQPDGKLAGTNIIDVIQDSCILREDWTSAGGNFSGTSYNFYNPTDDIWTQVWVDNQGGSLVLKGQFEEGKMVLTGEPVKDSSGNSVINRITWTPNPDGTVRQLWETKTDTAEWSVAFDGLYKRKNK